jgi:putative hydrolase of the HAD superfamily
MMKHRCVLFDLDNTLYPKSTGLMQAIGKRMNLFMTERLGIDAKEVSEKRDGFLKTFGTTLNALRRHYCVDPDEFLNFVHDLPIASYVQYEPALDQMLGRLELRKIVFTNADAQHARRVLSCLGITRHFESIVDIHTLEFVNKPDRRAYLKALDFVCAQAEECVLVEDHLPNIIPAGQIGMTTVIVGEDAGDGGAHHHIRRITELGELVGSWQ